MSEIPVLLVDDHGLVRKGFRRLLEEDVIRLVRQPLPQVLVMDTATPGLEGVQAKREIVKHEPEIAVRANLIWALGIQRTTDLIIYGP
jgi:DNA-binding NarL/FixJ family response regulator